jgi:hypothetical protein
VDAGLQGVFEAPLVAPHEKPEPPARWKRGTGGSDEGSITMTITTHRKRLGITYLVLAAVTAVLIIASAAKAQVVDEGGGEGNTPAFHLAALDTTTAFAVGGWSYSPVAIVVDFNVDCVQPVNDLFGRVVLTSGESVVVWTGNRTVGSPFLGWDFCRFDAYFNADFGHDGDGGLVTSAISGWLVSHNGR